MKKIRYIRIFSEEEYAAINTKEPSLQAKIVKVSKISTWPQTHSVFVMEHESGQPAAKLLALTIEEDEAEYNIRQRTKREGIKRRSRR
jgi:hypothetical protein